VIDGFSKAGASPNVSSPQTRDVTNGVASASYGIHAIATTTNGNRHRCRSAAFTQTFLFRTRSRGPLHSAWSTGRWCGIRQKCLAWSMGRQNRGLGAAAV